MTKKRRDLDGNLLRKGESQRKAKTSVAYGQYRFQYVDVLTRKPMEVTAQTLPELRDREKAIMTKQKLYKTVSTEATMTLNDAFDLYMDTYGRTRKPTTVSKKLAMYDNNFRHFATRAGGEGELRYILGDRIGSTRLIDISQEELIRFYNVLTEHISRPTIENINNLIRPVFRKLVRKGKLPYNPCCIDRDDFDFGEAGRRAALEQRDQVRLIDYVSGSKYKFLLPYIIFAIDTGMRISEIAYVRFSHVRDGMVIIDRQLQHFKNQEIGHTVFQDMSVKYNNSYRRIALTKAAERALQEIQSYCRKLYALGEWPDIIFLTPVGKPYYVSWVNQKLRSIVDDFNTEHPGDPLPHISTHIFRHTCNMNLYAAGVSKSDRNRWLGDSAGLDMADSFYYNLGGVSDARMRQLACLLDGTSPARHYLNFT